MRDEAIQFAKEGLLHVLIIFTVSAFLALIWDFSSFHSFYELLPKTGMLVGMLVALSGALSFMDSSGGYLTDAIMRLSVMEKRQESFLALVRIVAGFASFLLFLLFL